nr:MAG TPA: hypothetical protein [Caudoviricetes sp.]
MELGNRPSGVAKGGHGHPWACKVTETVMNPLHPKPTFTRDYNVFITFMDQSRVREFTHRGGHGHLWPPLTSPSRVAKNTPRMASPTTHRKAPSMTQQALIPETTPTPPTPRPRGRFLGPNPYGWTYPSGWRGAVAQYCRQCRAPILIGLDQDQAAIQVTVTATPLTALGEALHQLAGTPTYTLTRHGRRGIKLTRRRADNITQQPAGSPRIDVLPAHQCQPPPLPPEACTARQVAPPQTDIDRNTPPPF